MNHSEIQLRLMTKIKLVHGHQIGTGVFWKGDWTGDQYIILTCKHNLCHSQQDCELDCGTNCGFLNDLNTDDILVTNHKEEVIPIQKILVSNDKDIAVLVPADFDSSNLNAIFADDLCDISFWSDDFFDARVQFLGFPALFSNRNFADQYHCFDGYISFLDNQRKQVNFRNLSDVKIDKIAGVSGSGLFGTNENEQLILLGIISDYKGLASFRGTYVLDELSNWFTELGNRSSDHRIRMAVPQDSDEKMKEKISELKKHLEEIETLIFKFDKRVENALDETEREMYERRIELLEKTYLISHKDLKKLVYYE